MNRSLFIIASVAYWVAFACDARSTVEMRRLGIPERGGLLGGLMVDRSGNPRYIASALWWVGGYGAALIFEFWLPAAPVPVIALAMWATVRLLVFWGNRKLIAKAKGKNR